MHKNRNVSLNYDDLGIGDMVFLTKEVSLPSCIVHSKFDQTAILTHANAKLHLVDISIVVGIIMILTVSL